MLQKMGYNVEFVSTKMGTFRLLREMPSALPSIPRPASAGASDYRSNGKAVGY